MTVEQTLPAGLSRPSLGLVPATTTFADDATRADARRSVLTWLARRHEADASTLVAGPDELEAWVDEPIRELRRQLRGRRDRRARAGLDAVADQLAEALGGRTVRVGEAAGSLSSGRWWFDPAAGALVAVDGWDPAHRHLAQVDQVVAVAVSRPGHGGATVDAGTAGDLLERGWREEERAALAATWGDGDALGGGALVLLAWLAGDPVADRATRELLEELAPGGLLDLAGADEVLRVRPGGDAPQARRRAELAIDRALARAGEDRAGRRAATTTLALVGVAWTCWLAGTIGIDPAAMTDVGLVSILRPVAFAAPLLLLGAFGRELARAHPRRWRLATPVVSLVVLLHGTPAWLYGTLRYSWAWKHLGIIDHISRTGSVDPHASSLDVYQNWPGFFAVTSGWTDQVGLSDAIPYARWWPLAVNLVAIPVLLFVYRGLRGGRDEATGWLAVVIFLTANWIGQDYFSPQSMALLLYLFILGVALQCLGRGTAQAGGLATATRPRRLSIAIALLAGAALISSHQITPVVLFAALGSLLVTRQARTLRLIGVFGLMFLLWSVTAARPFLSANLADVADGFGQPVANADGNLVDQTVLSSGQVLVSTMGRAVLALVALAGLAGMARSLLARRVDWAAMALAGAPAVLLFANSFGGEIGFRAYLFALPFLAWFAATLLRPPADGRDPSARRRAVRATAAVALAAALLVGFAYAHYGKDAFYRFSGDEVAASGYVLDHASDGSLLVTVSTNYPGQWKNYERLTYVPWARESADSRAEILADPVGTMQRWMSGDDYTDSYLLITRSQEIETELLGTLPHGSVADFRAALEASPVFAEVYAGPDAQVFRLAADVEAEQTGADG